MKLAINDWPAARAVFCSLAIACVGMGIGCNSPQSGGTPEADEGASMRRLPGISQDAAFDASIVAIRQHFTQAFPSRVQGIVESPTIEYEQRGGTGRIRDAAVNYRNRMRRKATIWVTPGETGALVRCRVAVQRLDTADQRTFQSQREFNDVPNATPIEREAGVDPAKEQAWTDVSRDQLLERELLNIVVNQVQGAGEMQNSEFKMQNAE